MEGTESPVDQMLKHAEDYLKTRQQLTQHVVTEKVVVLTSTLVTAYILFALFAMAALFVSAGLAAWINIKTNDVLLGYWIVGGCYFLLGLLLFIFRKSLLHIPFMNAMVRNIYFEKYHA